MLVSDRDVPVTTEQLDQSLIDLRGTQIPTDHELLPTLLLLQATKNRAVPGGMKTINKGRVGVRKPASRWLFVLFCTL